jgi:hypothetical protein
VRVDASHVEVRCEGKLVARHSRCHLAQQEILVLEHYLGVFLAICDFPLSAHSPIYKAVNLPCADPVELAMLFVGAWSISINGGVLGFSST